jgi:hypothetical protein
MDEPFWFLGDAKSWAQVRDRPTGAVGCEPFFLRGGAEVC